MYIFQINLETPSELDSQLKRDFLNIMALLTFGREQHRMPQGIGFPRLHRLQMLS